MISVRTTDDISGAGTDSNITVQLFGTKGTSKTIRLNGRLSGDAFEEGDTDTVTVSDLGDLGAIVKLNIASDGSYSGSDWHLQDVTVTRLDDATLKKVGANPIGFATIISQGIKDGTVLQSTFQKNGWVTGDETVDGSRPGIDLARVEPAAVDAGGAASSPARIYIVYYADALDSNSKVDRPWNSKITLTKSLTLQDTTSNRVQIGAYVEYSYSPPSESGGSGGKAGLTAEYEHVKSSLKANSTIEEQTVERSETFSAAPKTLEFRVLVGSGTVATRSYRSTLTGQKFTATLASSDADLNPRQVTFTAGKVEDDKWNRSIARPFCLAKGTANYDMMVKRLVEMGCLKNPMSAQKALGK